MNRIKVLQPFIVTVIVLFAVGAGVLAAPRAPREFKLQAELPQFWNLVDQNAKLGVVGTGFGFTEGPCGTRRDSST